MSAFLTQQKQDIAQYANAFAHNKPHLNAAIRTAIEMGLFDILNKSESEKPAGELATITGGDKLLIPALVGGFKFLSVVCPWIFQYRG